MTNHIKEPIITINGHTLTEGQAMTIRVSINVFKTDLDNNGLGNDLHGEKMKEAYLCNLSDILGFIFINQKNMGND